jgi:outer membrane receptor protein involved in Fe transport
MNYRRISVLILLICAYGFLNAQGGLTGKLISSEGSIELPFAHVVLNEVEVDTTFHVISELDGSFILKKIPNGTYKLTITVLGYESFLIDSLKVFNEKVTLGKLKLKESSMQLNAVQIVGEKSFIESMPGKKVINVSQDIVNIGGSAIELLTMAPSVDVDVSGEISIRGQNDVFVLINGKETALSYLGAGQALKQIPISSIEKIEVITNAGAEFGPDGEGGIINIILKKGVNDGLKVTMGGNLGFSPINSSVNTGIQYNKGKFGASFSYNIDSEKETIKTSRYRMTKNSIDGLSTQKETNNSENNGIYHFVLGGFSFSANDSTDSGINLFYESENSKNILNQSFVIKNGNLPPKNNSTRGLFKGNNSIIGVDVTHSQKFRKGRDMDLYVGIYKGDNVNSTTNVQTGDQSPVYFYSNIVNQFTSMDGAFEFNTPLSEGIELSSGLQSDIMSFVTEQKTKVGDSLNVYAYQFNQNKHALYSSLNLEVLDFDVVLGGRVEYFTSVGKPRKGVEFNQEYFNFYPNVQLSYSFGKEKIEQGIMFSYSKRINRPEFEELNPTVRHINPLYLVKGNPNLIPEFGHVLEATHEFTTKKLNVSTTLFQRVTTNVIQEKQTLLNNNIVLSTYSNESKRMNLGAELYLKYHLFHWFDISNNFTVFNKQFTDAEFGFANATNWNNKFVGEISPGGGYKIQIQYKYVGQQNTLYTKTAPYSILNLGGSKSILKSKGKVFISVTDIFNQYKLVTTNVQEGFIVSGKTKYNTRMLKFGFLINLN